MVQLNNRFQERPLVQRVLPLTPLDIYGRGRDWIPKNSRKAPLAWYRYIDDIFFIWTHGKEHLQTFLQEFNNFNSDLKFTHKPNEKEIPIFRFKVEVESW